MRRDESGPLEGIGYELGSTHPEEDPDDPSDQAKDQRFDQKLVEDVLRKEVTAADRLAELFSTHPNIVKRLKALQQLA